MLLRRTSVRVRVLPGPTGNDRFDDKRMRKPFSAYFTSRNVISGVMCVILLPCIISLSHLSPNSGDQNSAPKSTASLLSTSLLFSIEPVTKSFHPKYKLWTEMNEEEQAEALDFVGKTMKKYGALIAPKGKGLKEWNSIKHGDCEFDPDIGKNGHTLCGPKPKPPCSFISFGINDDPSFDKDLGDWGSRGFAGDPTVHLPSKLHDKVTFHNIGATMLQDNEEREINKGGAEEWWMTSFPKLRYFLGLEKIDVLKIDCEGCEVALARDMLREDPYFLHHGRSNLHRNAFYEDMDDDPGACVLLWVASCPS